MIGSSPKKKKSPLTTSLVRGGLSSTLHEVPGESTRWKRGVDLLHQGRHEERLTVVFFSCEKENTRPKASIAKSGEGGKKRRKKESSIVVIEKTSASPIAGRGKDIRRGRKNRRARV